MKYGATLRQHSIPAWAHHNIDYDDIKHYIKENTSTGKGKSISIPGSLDVRGKELEDNLYGILQQQHQRITLFVKSKAGEIERRLNHLQKQTAQLASKPIGSGRIPAKRLERYGRLESDVLKAGEELRCLSRFSTAQQTAFRKLLKKHKKWTGSTDLQADFNRDILNDQTSFARIDLNPLLQEWEETLSTLRTLYEERIGGIPSTPGTPQTSAEGSTTQSTRARLGRVIESSSEVQFDSFFATSPLGREGKNAVYWVHPDNVVELQVLLLQYARTYAPRRQGSSATSPTLSRNNSVSYLASRRGSVANESDEGILIADDLEDFIARQSSSTFEEMENSPGAILQSAAVHARWTQEEEAMITARMTDNQTHKTMVRRKHVASVLNPSSDLLPRKASMSGSLESLDQFRSWLGQHQEVKPLATVTFNRSRFVDASDPNGFLLATLDKGIGMKQAASLTSPLEHIFSPNASAEFPFAVLRVRQEGSINNNLVKILDQNHLVEKVRGFSLEYHAVWYCCQPDNVVPPFWTPLLQRDIKKLPTTVSRSQAKSVESGYGSQSTTPQMSTSTGSVVDRAHDLNVVEARSPTKVTIADQLQTPPLSAFRKKRKSSFQRPAESVPKQKYWSEYDNPSDSEDEGAYVLYIDPNEESSATRTWRSIRRFLSGQKKADQQPLLGHDGTLEAGLVDDTLTSSDEEAQIPKRASRQLYGTVGEGSHEVAQHTPHGTRSDWIPYLTTACLMASVLLLCVGYILVATGRRKLASEVDAGIVLVVASSLAFAVSGVGVTFGRRTPSWTAAAAAVGVLIADAAASSMLLVWAFG